MNFKTDSKHDIGFYRNLRTQFPTALGIEILCIIAAVIGENSAFLVFGYNLQGILLGFLLGYLAAGFATLMTILGRFELETKVDTCCSILEREPSKGFVFSAILSFKTFGVGLVSFRNLFRHPNLKQILKTSLIILITAESTCILVAESIDLILYQYSLLLSIPLALVGGSFTIVAIELYRKRAKQKAER